MPSIDMIDKETKDTNEKKQRRHDATAMKENTKIHKEKKPHWHDANANEEHRNTEPHPAASYVPGKCHRTLDPADKGQETKDEQYGAAACKCSGAYKPKTKPTSPITVACSIERTRTGPRGYRDRARACNNR